MIMYDRKENRSIFTYDALKSEESVKLCSLTASLSSRRHDVWSPHHPRRQQKQLTSVSDSRSHLTTTHVPLFSLFAMALSLDKNLFYRSLVSTHHSLFTEASDNCGIICVPRNKKLRDLKIDVSLIQAHCLKASPFLKKYEHLPKE